MRGRVGERSCNAPVVISAARQGGAPKASWGIVALCHAAGTG